MNSITLIGRVNGPITRSTFVLAADDVEISVTCGRPPKPGDRVAVEGSLRSRAGLLFVEARALDVLPRHML